MTEAQSIAPILTVQNWYNVAHRGDELLIASLNEQGVSYNAFWPLGGFNPLQLISSRRREVTCRVRLGHPWRGLVRGRRRTAVAGQPVAGATAPDEKLMRSPAMVSSECSVRMSSTGTEK